jgi:hypothetical protein
MFSQKVLFRTAFSLTLISLLGACSHPVTAPSAPALNVYTSYSDKIPGRFALVVEAGGWYKIVKPSSHICAAHDFPFDANSAFKESVKRTVEQLVDQVEIFQTPPTRETMNRDNITGTIIIKADTFEPRLTFVPGFWSGSVSSTIDMSANLTVDGPQGRLLGTSAGASRTSDNSNVGSCADGMHALSDASSKGIRELMERLGERLGNAQKVREVNSPKTS